MVAGDFADREHRDSVKRDIVGSWTEKKHEILEKYANAYTTALKKQPFKTIFVDGFAGAGECISKESGDILRGSPLRALSTKHPFDHYFFVDLDGEKAEHLKTLVGDREDVTIFQGDCNVVLREKIIPIFTYRSKRKGLFFLDPYGLHLRWEVLKEAGESGAIEIFLNFPLYDMNLNVLWKRDPVGQDPRQIARMDAFWGDNSWYEAVYDTAGDLFGHPEKALDANIAVALAFQERLRSKGSFEFVVEPVPMFNSSNSVLYYIFFASNNSLGAKIAKDVLKSYRQAK